jgi:acyl-coenzyme A thioesterase PaaI-like protein
MNISDNQYCFICGHRNPVGLKATMKVDREGKSAACTLVIPSEYQGWKDMVHGGIISALLDEVCVYAGMTVSASVVTGELKTRFRKPVPVEQEVTVSARVTNQVRRTVLVEAQLTMEGIVLASAEAKLVIVRS